MEMSHIGAKIEALRKERKITQETLGKAVGLTPSAISNIERNRSTPSVETLGGLAEYFGVSVDSLMSTKQHKNFEQLQLEEKLRTVERYLGNEYTSISCSIGDRCYMLECEQGNIKYQACSMKKEAQKIAD